MPVLLDGNCLKSVGVLFVLQEISHTIDIKTAVSKEQARMR